MIGMKKKFFKKEMRWLGEKRCVCRSEKGTFYALKCEQVLRPKSIGKQRNSA